MELSCFNTFRLTGISHFLTFMIMLHDPEVQVYFQKYPAWMGNCSVNFPLILENCGYKKRFCPFFHVAENFTQNLGNRAGDIIFCLAVPYVNGKFF